MELYQSAEAAGYRHGVVVYAPQWGAHLLIDALTEGYPGPVLVVTTKPDEYPGFVEFESVVNKLPLGVKLPTQTLIKTTFQQPAHIKQYIDRGGKLIWFDDFSQLYQTKLHLPVRDTATIWVAATWGINEMKLRLLELPQTLVARYYVSYDPATGIGYSNPGVDLSKFYRSFNLTRVEYDQQAAALQTDQVTNRKGKKSVVASEIYSTAQYATTGTGLSSKVKNLLSLILASPEQRHVISTTNKQQAAELLLTLTRNKIQACDLSHIVEFNNGLFKVMISDSLTLPKGRTGFRLVDMLHYLEVPASIDRFFTPLYQCIGYDPSVTQYRQVSVISYVGLGDPTVETVDQLLYNQTLTVIDAVLRSYNDILYRAVDISLDPVTHHPTIIRS